MSGFIDLTGQKFGKLTVIRRVVGKYKYPFWYCVCECGMEAVCNSGNLTGGHTKSCGCLQSEWCKSNFSTHGLRNHPLYRIWAGILQRCDKEYTTNYHIYGGNGVSVCREWYDFKTFYNWAINNKWERGMQIDKDIKAKELGVEANLYSPERCSIVTAKINSRHRKTTKLTEELASEIKASKDKVKVIMQNYGVSKSTIGNIRAGRSWK